VPKDSANKKQQPNSKLHHFKFNLGCSANSSNEFVLYATSSSTMMNTDSDLCPLELQSGPKMIVFISGYNHLWYNFKVLAKKYLSGG
jgi:hypothetical protein